MFGVAWDYYSSKLKGKQYKQTTTSKSYKTEIKIIANPGLAPGGVLPEKLSGGVRPASQNPYPIYDQNLRYSLSFLWPDS